RRAASATSSTLPAVASAETNPAENASPAPVVRAGSGTGSQPYQRRIPQNEPGSRSSSGGREPGRSAVATANPAVPAVTATQRTPAATSASAAARAASGVVGPVSRVSERRSSRLGVRTSTRGSTRPIHADHVTPPALPRGSTTTRSSDVATPSSRPRSSRSASGPPSSGRRAGSSGG